MGNRSKICLSLDGLSAESSLLLAREIGARCCAVKIHDLLDMQGPSIIKDLERSGAKCICVDYKIKEKPASAALRVRALARNGARIITVDASGGMSMMRASVESARADDGHKRAEIWALTLLSTLDTNEIATIHGTDRNTKQIVLSLALMAKRADVDGIICSGEEVGFLWQSPDLAGTRIIAVGTRSIGVVAGEQKRTSTPAQAVANGADIIIVGSEVTRAENPFAAFNTFAAQIGEGET